MRKSGKILGVGVPAAIFGGAGNDVIDAGIDADEIFGGDGNDTIIGGEGSDTIEGGDGNDTIFAGLEPGTDLFGIPEQIDDDLGDPEPDNGDDTVFGGAGESRTAADGSAGGGAIERPGRDREDECRSSDPGGDH